METFLEVAWVLALTIAVGLCATGVFALFIKLVVWLGEIWGALED